MKKILVVIPSLEIGGTVVSLFNLLSLIDKNKYDIDILIMSPYGNFRKKFPNATLLNEYVLLSALIVSSYKDVSLYKRIIFTVVKVCRRIFNCFNFNIEGFIFSIYRNNFNKYDFVISYQEGITTRFVSSIKCKKRIAWVHCDYENYLKMFNAKYEDCIYNSFDNIVFVSRFTKATFQKYMLKINLNKMIVINNTINESEILELSKENICDKRFLTDLFTIVSIGRIDPVKQFSLIPQIAAYLKKEGCLFNWYLIGGGDNYIEKEAIKQNANEYCVNDCFVYLSEKTNPYKYIKNSDLVVCLSISESFNYVINEAKVLSIPVITTNFGCSTEFINDNETGIITSIEKIGEKIKMMMVDSDCYDLIKNNLKNNKYNNDSIISKFDSLFN